MTIEELIKALESGDTSVFQDKAGIDTLLSVLKSVASGKKPQGVPENIDLQEFVDLLGRGLTLGMSSEEGRQTVIENIQNRQTDRFVRKNKPFFDAILSGVDLATSLSQIHESNKAIRNLRKPTMPSPEVLDPAINSAIAEAQRGSLESLRALEPAKQEIAQQRLIDLQTARSVSGGQSGAFGALANASSLRAMRAATSLPAIQDTIRGRQQQRADNLIGLRQNVRQQEFGNRLAIADRNLEQYVNDMAAAGALGQAGRTNLRSTLGNMSNILPQVVGRMLPTNYPQQQAAQPQAPQYTSPMNTGVGNPVWDEYSKTISQNLLNRIRGQNRATLSPTPKLFQHTPSYKLKWELENLNRSFYN